MVELVSDARIAAMIAEGKPLPLLWRWELATLKPREGRNEGQLNFTGNAGTAFRIVVRHQGERNFSVILLAVLDKPVVPGRPEFPLLRYDGANHNHIGQRSVTNEKLINADRTGMPRKRRATRICRKLGIVSVWTPA